MHDVLFDTFSQFFEVVPAEEESLIQEAQALRYQVYCLEHDYEDRDSFSTNLETDEFDKRSVHSIIRYLWARKGGKTENPIIATVRLVLTASSADGLPIEHHCAISPEIKQHVQAAYSRPEIAEISRFCVSKDFRKRLRESETVHGIVESDPSEPIITERRAIPHITLGLFQAIVRMSQQQSIRLWYAVMEPQLVRLLRRFGIHFSPIGEPVQYHGLRVPCIGPVDEVMEGIQRERPDVWEFITRNGSLWPY